MPTRTGSPPRWNLNAGLDDLRRDLERVVIVRGERLITGADLCHSFDVLRDHLSQATTGRVALLAPSCEALVVALLACNHAGRELLLLRDGRTAIESQLAEWNVGLLLGEDLNVLSRHSSAYESAGCSILIPTSGTTGLPKLAIHRVDTLLRRVVTPAGGADVRWLLTYNPATFAGLQVILTAVIGGSTLLCADDGRLADLFDVAARHRPTHVSGTPTFWRALLLAVDRASSTLPLKQITIGGEAVEQELLDRLAAAFPTARIVHIYASTEAGALFAVTDRRSGFPARWLDEGVEGISLRIRDGALEVISPRAMSGYADDRRPPLSDDGWLMTGDLVELRADRVHFCGRVDAMINVGGAKVIPEEVERVLMELPFVREVRVFGKANPIVGALVNADIVLADESIADPRSAILRHASARLDSHKVPRVLNFVSAIAVNASGKKTR
jgi:acyl-coenzyme A synthetase/AMP-(fatty) acid ligase